MERSPDRVALTDCWGRTLSSFYERPVLNSPYRQPELHHPLDDRGQPVDGEPLRGPTPARFIVPVPASRKKAAAAQTTLDLETCDRVNCRG